ncbi:MAG: BREX-1 system phosphatase PglZ type B [Planctomycetes bacterium]|nr:BREX-1 system phosphatase PglZ type B [Planctomycetota bacterium]
MSPAPPKTLLEALVRALRSCGATSGDSARPAAILWTDPEHQWAELRELLLAELPELLVFGSYRPDRRTGPAIWLRCVIDQALEEPAMPPDRTPIVWLPGVSRQQLRAGPDCPAPLQPLVELMFRGTLWLQRGGHDWTLSAFLGSAQGVGLDLAKDEATREALRRALREVALTPLAQLGGRRLEAEDFDRLLSSDLLRDVLRWMSDPASTRERLGANGWGACRSLCREKLAFDPETQADVTAGELLGAGEGSWREVWERFAESPAGYPGIEALLRRSSPAGVLRFHREPWPDLNDDDEAAIRKVLAALPNLEHGRACQAIVELDGQHAKRRTEVWARLGRSPMAVVLEPLRRLAESTRSVIAGSSAEEIASVYMCRGWQADAASWESLALAPTADEALIGAAVRHLLLPWLEASAQSFQAALAKVGLPSPLMQGLVQADDDGCLLFSDGLRFDLGQRLAERLEGRGFRVRVGHRWAATPTVTATAKPGVTPVADVVRGRALREDFAVELALHGRAADAANLRAAMRERGYQVLDGEELETPQASPARGWCEAGDIDTLGHQVGGRLARQIDEELERLCDRIERLLDSGWRSVQVVTDHGWLLLPGGLPKVDLPKHLTASRWARCAAITAGAQPAVPLHPWTWNPAHSFAYAPGIACFHKAEEYAHGGLSIQECLTPRLWVERASSAAPRVAIESVTWRGLRCFVAVRTTSPEVFADLRLGSPAGVTVAASSKRVEVDGSVSLVLSDDEHEAAALVLVLLDGNGQILAQKATRVGAHS